MARFKNYYYVPINMKSSLKTIEDIIDWGYIDMIINIHTNGISSKYSSLHSMYSSMSGDNKLFEK